MLWTQNTTKMTENVIRYITETIIVHHSMGKRQIFIVLNVSITES